MYLSFVNLFHFLTCTSLALFFKSIPTFFLNLISPAKLQTSQIKLNRSHTKAHNTFLTLFVGAGSFLIAFIFGSLLLIPGDSSAEESIATLSNDPALAVAITPENLNLSITPTPSGSLSADELNINVNTDNETGYVMSLASANETTDLTDVSTSSSIHSTTATTDNPAVLSANTWGWYPNSLVNNPGYNNSNPADSNYQFATIPSYDDPYTLKQTNTATSDSGDNIPVSIAANVDTSLPAGAYSNIITITTITNYVPRPILDVYPTTGWAGDTITLYSNDGFINVTSVTVGGTECTSLNLVSQDELQCILPDKAETNPDSDNGYNITVTASGTELDTHNFTIRYFNPSRTETASVSNTQIANINMDDFTSIDCGSLSVGDIISLTDERNGQTYRIKKMQDEKCWMVDNMKYKGEGITISNIGDGTEGITLNDTEGRLNTIDGTDSEAASGTGTNWDKAFYNNPMVASYCYGDSIQSSYTKCGYLYNWYATTAGNGTYSIDAEGTNVADSICPTGWRLPSAMSDGSTATGNGTSYTAADFAVLNASMNAGSLTSGSTTSSYYANWLFTGAWSGVFSGVRGNSFYYQGSYGYYWSSTTYSSATARRLYFDSSSVSPGSNYNSNKYNGFATRCVKDGAITITYDGNGADNGSMDTQLIAVGDTQNLLGNTYTRTGYEFIGWNTSADGSGQSYNDGTSYTVSANPDNYYPTLYAQWKKLTFACTARYKLQNADGTYPSSYTTVTVNPAAEYGSICSYTTTQNSSQYTNQSAQATVTSPTVLTVGTDGQVPRRTYNLTVTAGSNTSGATGSGTYRYGQTVTASVTKATNTTCTSYATPTWSKNSGATGTLSSTSGTSITYTMGTTNDTITATSASGNINQTITFYTTGGASSITLNGTSRTNGQTMSIACGTYSLTGSFNTNYEFSSWSKSGSGSIANTGTLSTIYTVNGTGSITLNGKSSIVGYMQDFTKSQCQSLASSSPVLVQDRRDNSTYTVRYINGNCWMTQNLRLAGGTTVTPSDSNVASNYTIPNTDLTSGNSYTDGRIHNSGNATYGYWYNYCATSAGTVCNSYLTQNAIYDICPAGWRLPTNNEHNSITGSAYISAFSPVAGGSYYDGSLNTIGYGHYWSSTGYSGTFQYDMYYNSTILGTYGSRNKYCGYYIRCIRSS